jgi:large subunit ribosomal protein L21
MNLAVIKTGGKQYIVTAGQKLKVEKLAVIEKDKIDFSEVLMVADDKNIKIGQPFLQNAKVAATVLSQGKADKVVGHHYKPKTRNKKKFGHRQPFTEVEITKIS